MASYGRYRFSEENIEEDMRDLMAEELDSALDKIFNNFDYYADYDDCVNEELRVGLYDIDRYTDGELDVRDFTSFSGEVY